MSDNKDTSEVFPALKLSRCSRKPRKRSVNSSVTHNAEKPAKRKRKPKNIPIPSFSPVNKVEEIDASILDTPEKEKEHEVVLLQDDDDDDDALLLMGPPTFATLTRKQSPIEDEKKPEAYINKQKRTFAGAQQASIEETSVEENDSKRQVDELPNEIIQTIENLLRQVMDSDNVTVRDVVNRVATKHGYSKDDKAMRKLIRAHVRSFMKQANEADDSPQESLAEASTETDTPGTRSTTVASFNDGESSNTAKPCNNTATIRPDEEDLTVSIDGLFLQAEGQVATLSNFLMALEGEYGAKLHKTSRAFVKERLKGLKDGTIDPIVSLPSTPCFGDAAKASTLQRNESPVPDNSDMDIPMDGDTEPAINTALDQTAVAKKKHETEKTNVEADQPQPSPEKGNEKPRKRGHSTKNANTVEAVEITDESNPSSGEMSGRGDNQEKLPVKEVPKKPPAPRKPRAPRAKKGTCALCTSCTCTIEKEASVNGTPGNMSRNDAEIERALIRRTKKLEGLVDKYQGLLDNVNRELKKHRRAIWKKQEDGRRFAFGDSRFLPDADVWDEQADAVHLEALPTAVAEEAKSTLFGNGNCQATLTQMFGGGDKKDENASQDAGSGERDNEKDTVVLDTCSQTVTDEDKEEVPGGHESVVDHSDLDSEAEPVDRIHRLTWRRGTRVETQSTLLRGSGAWSAITTKTTQSSPRDANPDLLQSIVLPPNEDDTFRSDFHDGDKYNCAWDALFADDISEEDDEGMDQLLDLFETVMSQDDEQVTSDTSTPVHSVTQRSEFETVPLTQRGQEIADKIEEEIISDPMRLQPIEAVCPKWRDNIRYALSQRGPAEIRQALERVRRSMNNLQNTKQKVSTVWKRQEVALQLFETSLSASLSRLPPSEESRENGAVNSEGNEPTPTSPTHLKRATVLSPIIEGNESLS